VPDQLSGLERVVEIADGKQALPQGSASRGACPRNTWGLEGAALPATRSDSPVAHGANPGSGPQPNDTQPRCSFEAVPALAVAGEQVLFVMAEQAFTMGLFNEPGYFVPAKAAGYFLFRCDPY